jgi:peptidoglycan/LPS O-acetylase OafA/YrhL
LPPDLLYPWQDAIYRVMTTNRLNYTSSLDGMRALAILAVLSFHGLGPVSLAMFGSGGWLGVDCFFVLSGFLITKLLLDELSGTKTINIRAFFLRRVFRILPVYTAFILITALVNPFHRSDIWRCALVAGSFLSDYDIALGGHSIASTGFENSWSLAVEEKFYLIWPFLLTFFSRNPIKLVATSLILSQLWRAFLIFHGADSTRLGAAFDTKFDDILWGALAATLMHAGYWQTVKQRTKLEQAAAIFLPLALLAASWFTIHPHLVRDVGGQLVYWNIMLPCLSAATAAFLVSLTVNSNSLEARFLSFKPLVWIGKLSYSLYLWHALAFGLAAFISVYFPFTAQTPYLQEVWTLAVCVSMAAVSYYGLEKPFLKLKKKFEQLPTAESAVSLSSTVQNAQELASSRH